MAISTIDSSGINQAGDTVLCTTSGNLGVGTSAPAAKLDVRGETSYLINATSPTAWISADASLATGTIYNQWNTSSSLGVTGTYTNHPYTFVTNNTERMRIDQNGNVGINTAAPLFPLTLRTQSDTPYTFAIGNESTYNLSIIYFLQAGSNVLGYTSIQSDARYSQGYLGFHTAGVEQVRIDSGGVVTGTAGNLMLVSGTAVGAGGTAIDFTGIPSWVKRITVQLAGVSTNGALPYIIQIGSGGFATTGYSGQAWTTAGGGVRTDSFPITAVPAAATTVSGQIVLTKYSSNAWVSNGVMCLNNATSVGYQNAGRSPDLGGPLDRVRLTTTTGVNSFDAGTVSILYE